MTKRLTRRTFGGMLGLFMLAWVWPGRALAAAGTAAETTTRLRAARSTISLLEHESFRCLDGALCRAHFIALHRHASGPQSLVPLDFKGLAKDLEHFKVVASAFMRRPSPRLADVEGKRRLLARLPDLEAVVSDADLAVLKRRWAQWTEADAENLNQDGQNEHALAFDRHIQSRWPRTDTLARA